MVTFFVALLVLDARRQKANLSDFPLLFCCMKSKESDMYKQPIRDVPWGLSATVRTRLGPFLAHPIVKAAVVLAYLGLLSGAIVGVLKLKEGLELKNLAPFCSYFRARIQAEEKTGADMVSSELSVAVSLRKVDFATPATQASIDAVTRKFEKSKWTNRDPQRRITSWLRGFEDWETNQTAATCPPDFSACLNNFLSTEGERYEKDVLRRPTDGTVKASRYFVLTKATPDFLKQRKLMTAYRDIAEDSDFARKGEILVYHPGFYYFEQSIVIRDQTLLNLGCAASAVLVLTYIFLAHPAVCFSVLVMIVSIDAMIVGYMSHWGIPLDSITMINLVMAIGFAVDYSAHIAHAFMQETGTHNERMIKALQSMGVSVANGALSTLLATLPLIGSSSYIFYVFFQMFFMAVLFGATHGLIFLPVLLSLIGPRSSSHRSADEQKPKDTRKIEPSGEEELPRLAQMSVPSDLQTAPGNSSDDGGKGKDDSGKGEDATV
ncbi:unnamed protein product [Vitrella brassicaformis CCMP3155]|uniref:SSD domain-containing protein n=1 Tax=Vitrella brassicaformis (strain CCMP3155) TaxID=1169540 RepID=A0A0G4FDG1_VITBC|nr:unnamed protein product [Vitrella brassicaformis CCMP3155]|eukprot:CEM10946.1 unnamed protein product [Vitrella brassicaformis CCMP3155]